MRIVAILAIIGIVQTYQFMKGQHIDATIIAELTGSLVLAAGFGVARAATVRLSFRQGQWWSQGTWLTVPRTAPHRRVGAAPAGGCVPRRGRSA